MKIIYSEQRQNDIINKNDYFDISPLVLKTSVMVIKITLPFAERTTMFWIIIQFCHPREKNKKRNDFNHTNIHLKY